jgi:hypothetical protein
MEQFASGVGGCRNRGDVVAASDRKYSVSVSVSISVSVLISVSFGLFISDSDKCNHFGLIFSVSVQFIFFISV